MKGVVPPEKLPRGPRRLDVRRKKLREELLKNGGNLTKAGIAAGYSPTYSSQKLWQAPHAIQARESLLTTLEEKERELLQALTVEKMNKESARGLAGAIVDINKVKQLTGGGATETKYVITIGKDVE